MAARALERGLRHRDHRGPPSPQGRCAERHRAARWARSSPRALRHDARGCAVYARDGVTGERDPSTHRLRRACAAATSSATTPVLFAGTGERDRDHAPLVQPRHLRPGQPARGALPGRPARTGLFGMDDVLGLALTGRGLAHDRLRELLAAGRRHHAAASRRCCWLMSVSAWVVIFWKGWLLRRVRARHRSARCRRSGPRRRSTAGASGCAAFDREAVLRAAARRRRCTAPPGGTLEAERPCRLAADAAPARRAARRAAAQLQFGQVLLASIGSTAPFIGLFGTVWGIYHALLEHLGRRHDHDREGLRPGRRSAGDDGRRPGGRDPRGARLQHLRQAGRRAARPSSRASPTTCAR